MSNQGLEGLVREWRDRAKELDDRVRRAAALHNLSEYKRLVAKRNTLEQCADELYALIHGSEQP